MTLFRGHLARFHGQRSTYSKVPSTYKAQHERVSAPSGVRTHGSSIRAVGDKAVLHIYQKGF
jgi:hypothetical protein